MAYTSNFEPDSIYLLREEIADRKELRRLRKLPALGCRGPNDLTDSGGELFCPGGLSNERNGTWFIAWELRLWNPEINGDPDAVKSLSTWRHLLNEGFRVTGVDELEAKNMF